MERCGDFRMQEYTSSAEAQILQDILQEGSLLNIHCICDVRVPSHFDKMYRNSNFINFFKHRIVHHLGSSDESRMILGNNVAANIYKNMEPHTRNRAYYYNSEFENQYQKIKPYVNILKEASFFPFNIHKKTNETILDIKDCLSYQTGFSVSVVEENEKVEDKKMDRWDNLLDRTKSEKESPVEENEEFIIDLSNNIFQQKL